MFLFFFLFFTDAANVESKTFDFKRRSGLFVISILRPRPALCAAPGRRLGEAGLFRSGPFTAFFPFPLGFAKPPLAGPATAFFPFTLGAAKPVTAGLEAAFFLVALAPGREPSFVRGSGFSRPALLFVVPASAGPFSLVRGPGFIRSGRARLPDCFSDRLLGAAAMAVDFFLFCSFIPFFFGDAVLTTGLLGVILPPCCFLGGADCFGIDELVHSPGPEGPPANPPLQKISKNQALILTPPRAASPGPRIRHA